MKTQQNIDITPATKSWYADHHNGKHRQAMSQIVSDHARLMDGHPVLAMFADPAQASEYMITAWRHMWRHTLASLKGHFTAQELSLIIDCHNAHALTPMSYGSGSVLHNVADAITLDGLADKWEVDGNFLKEKIAGLSSMQEFCLEIWATGFWYGSNQARGVPEYTKTLE